MMANVNGNSIPSTWEYIVFFLTVILPVILQVLFLRELCLKDLQLWANSGWEDIQTSWH